jgi:hypothetical protein
LARVNQVIFFVAQIHHFAQKSPQETGQGNFLENFTKSRKKSIEIIKIFGGFGQIFSFLF